MGQSIGERPGVSQGCENSAIRTCKASASSDQKSVDTASTPPAGTLGLTESSTRTTGQSPQENRIAELAPGTVVGRYLIVGKIAAGGMGAIYKAFDPELDRKVAVKVVSVAHGDTDAAASAAARLVREAKSLAQLSHPNVVSVYDVGSFGTDVFIAMALVEGQTLRSWMETDRSSHEIVGVFAAAGLGLAAAHKAGLVHRDFKPDNVLVGNDGRVQVVDFGIALAEEFENSDLLSEGTLGKGEGTLDSSASQSGVFRSQSGLVSGSISATDRLTKLGALVGTPRYMSPEQFSGSTVDAKSDQFSFCVALFEALYGQRPFSGKKLAELRRNVVAGKLRRVAHDSRVPKRLRRLVERGLSVHPNDRFESMETLLAQLRQDPHATIKRVGLAMLIAAVVGLAIALLTIDTLNNKVGARCQTAEHTAHTIWSVEARQRVQSAISAASAVHGGETATRVVARIGTRMADWARVATAVCEATWIRGTQSETLLDLRMGCLERRRNETESLIELLSSNVDEALAARAVRAVLALSSIDQCARITNNEDTFPVPTDPQKKSQLASLEKRLDTLGAMHAAGRYQRAIEPSRAIVADADALDYPPVQAEALMITARILSGAGEFAEAEDIYARGLTMAARARNYELVALIAAKRIFLIGYRRDRHAEALAMVANAEAAAIQAGDGANVRSELQRAIGALHSARGDYATAVKHVRAALRADEELFGDDDVRLAPSLNNLGLALLSLNKFAEGSEQLRRARDLWEAGLGADHPTVAAAYNNLGIAYLRAGRLAEALESYERALAIWQRVHGPDHPYIATGLANTGTALMDLGRLDEAAARYRRALSIRHKRFGPRHQQVGLALHGLGMILNRQHNYQDALARHEAALAAFEATVGPDHEFTGQALLGIGRAQLGRRRPSAAVTPLKRALKVYSKNAPQYLAQPQFALARALWDSRQDQRRALSLARRARAMLAQQSAVAPDALQEVDTWLAARGEKLPRGRKTLPRKGPEPK